MGEYITVLEEKLLSVELPSSDSIPDSLIGFPKLRGTGAEAAGGLRTGRLCLLASLSSRRASFSCAS